MYWYTVVEVLILLTGSGIATSDSLDNSEQPPLSYSTSTHGNTQTFPYQSSVGDLKNLPKNSPNVYAASASNQVLLHKTHYSSPRVYNPNTELHHDYVPIVKQTFEPNSGDGAYAFSYETGNGISASEYGTYKSAPGGEEGIQSASGSYSYTGPDNIVYTVTYTAGLEGFVPQGVHLPTPPPIPEAIQQILQYADTEENSKYQSHENEPNKYQPYSAGKYQEKKEPSYATNTKYQSTGDVKTSSNKYTAAVQIPYTGYKHNTNYVKLTRSYNNNEYKVHDEFSK